MVGLVIGVVFFFVGLYIHKQVKEYFDRETYLLKYYGLRIIEKDNHFYLESNVKPVFKKWEGLGKHYDTLESATEAMTGKFLAIEKERKSRILKHNEEMEKKNALKKQKHLSKGLTYKKFKEKFPQELV